MSWRERVIEDWPHFVSILEKTGGTYLYPSVWSYRGQVDRQWTLRPSLYRRLHANSIVDVAFAHEMEQHLLGEFILRYPTLNIGHNADFKRFDTLRWLSMMQHYSAPTRLLDWTSSPYVAAFFACESSYDKDGVIWCYANSGFLMLLQEKHKERIKDKSEDDFLWKTEGALVHHFTTHFQNRRCLTQQGEFTVSSQILGDHDEFIDSIFSDIESDKKIFHTKLIIPSALKLQFLSRLLAMGISTDTLYPGGDGFGRHLSNILDIRANTEGAFRAAGLPRRSDSSEFAKPTVSNPT